MAGITPGFRGNSLFTNEERQQVEQAVVREMTKGISPEEMASRIHERTGQLMRQQEALNTLAANPKLTGQQKKLIELRKKKLVEELLVRPKVPKQKPLTQTVIEAATVNKEEEKKINKKSCSLSSCAKTAEKLSKCGRCRIVRYCSPVCQEADWEKHKPVCVEKVKKVELEPEVVVEEPAQELSFTVDEVD